MVPAETHHKNIAAVLNLTALAVSSLWWFVGGVIVLEDFFGEIGGYPGKSY